jgi:nucleoside-diphosphate kinase
MNSNITEQTLSIIKPDAVERNLENEIKDFFNKNGLKIKKNKKVKISKEEASEFYKVHQTKPFYNDLCDYLSSGPIVVMILEGEDAVLKNRKLMGATDPKNAEEGTLRKLYGVSIDKNSVHGSDSIENAKQEINFFFK